MQIQEKKAFIKNGFFSFIKSFFTLIFPLITFPYASRILLPEGIGKVNFANSIVSYFIILAQLGIGKYATREVSKIKNDKIQLSKFCREILIINFFSMLIAFFLFFISIFSIPKLSNYRALLCVCSAKIFFLTIGLDWFYIAIERFRYITITSIIFQFFSLIFLFIFVKTKDDYIYYAVFGMISSVGSNTCNIIYSRKFIDYKIKFHYDIKKHVKYIFTFFGMSLITSIYEILDTTMLGFLSTDAQVGYYSAGIKINKMSVELLTAITVIFLPRLTQYFKEKKNDEFIKLVQKGQCFITMFAIPMTAGIIVLAKPLILIFSGKDFINGILPMQILAPVLFFISLNNFFGSQVLPSINKETTTLFSYLFAALFNLSLNLLLIPHYGAIGAAIATVIAEFTAMFIQVIYLRKIIINKKSILNFVQFFISSIFMILIIVTLNKIISNNIIQIIVGILLGIIVYSLSLIIFHNFFFYEIINNIKKLDIFKK